MTDILTPSAPHILRKWMPHDYQDECVPPARATPSDWIFVSGQICGLASADADYGGPAISQPLSDGDVVLFDWMERHGNAELTFHASENEAGEDGWVHHCDRELPKVEGASSILRECGDNDTIACSIAEFVENHLACDRNNADGSPEDVTLEFYVWSDEPVEFVFREGKFYPMGSPS